MTEQQLIQIFKTKNFAPKSLEAFLTQHVDKNSFLKNSIKNTKLVV